MTCILQSILLVLTLGLGQFSFAQEPAYSWGEPATNDFLERRIDKLLVLDNQGFVLLRKYTDNTYNAHYWIEYYSPELKFEGNVPVEFNGGVMGNSYEIEDVLVANGKIYAFVAHWDKTAGKNTLSINELSLSGALSHLKELDFIPAKKMGNRGAFRLSLSKDEQKLLVMAEQPFVKKTNEKIRLSCFDMSSLDLIWFHDQELSLPSSKAVQNEVIVDNRGRAFIFKKDYQKIWSYFLYSYGPESKWKEYSGKSMLDLTVLDFQLGTDQSDQFFLFATYTKAPSAYKKHLHGSWYFGLDGALEIKADRQSSWGSEMLAYFGGDKMAKDPDNGKLEDFYIKDILLRADGNLLVLMEQLRSKQDLIEGSSPMKYTYEWNYGQFLALNIKPQDGSTSWWQTFQKSQELRSNFAVDEFGSFIYFLKEDRLYLLWNNTNLSVPSIPPANWTEPDGTKYVKRKAFDDKTVHGTFMYVIEPDGSLAYGNRKFGLPLFNLHQGAVFEMSLTTPFFFSLDGDLVVLSNMHNGGKRFRFGFLGL